MINGGRYRRYRAVGRATACWHIARSTESGAASGEIMLASATASNGAVGVAWHGGRRGEKSTGVMAA